MRLFPVLESLSHRALVGRGVRSQLHQTASGAVHVYDAPGRGPLPPVALVHGFSSSGAALAPLLGALAPHVSRVLVPELPGHGHSGAPAKPLDPEVLYEGVRAALDAELTTPAVLFGNSLGGAVALRYAVERPTRVAGLFLASPAGAPFSPDELASVRALFQPRSAAEARAFFQRAYVRARWFYPLLAPALRTHFSQEKLQRFLDNARPGDGLTPDELGSLAMPVLLWWGREERVLPPSLLAYYRAHLPASAVIEEPEGVGHCPHTDDPRGLAERLTRFARSLPA